MALTEELVEGDLYRVVLVLPRSKMVLAERHNEILRLPRIRIPQWTRIAEQLTNEFLKAWNVRSVLIDVLPGALEIPRCAVIEIRSPDWEFAADGFYEASIDDLDEQEMTTAECVTVQSILAGDAQDRGPFSRLGWIDEAKEWVRENVSDHAFQFSDDTRQLNAGGSFSLIRFGTLKDPAYWLKATGEPNRHELSVTAHLAKISPELIPPLVATREDWNAWAMEEVGSSLAHSVSLITIKLAGSGLAELQKQTVGQADELFRSGCLDQRLDLLSNDLSEVFQYLKKMRPQKESEDLPELDLVSYSRLEDILREAIDRMKALNIPDTVTNNDLKLANILSDGHRCVFTDWCHAYVGNPFLAFQHVHTYLLRRLPDLAIPFQHSYSATWRTQLSVAQVDDAFSLSPLLAPYAYLHGQGIERIARRVEEPNFQRFCRRLMLHMWRVANDTQFLGVLCK